jgi:hypothetical protein
MVMKKMEWGVDLRKKSVGNHTLRTRGYGMGKKIMWAKEDKIMEENHQENPVSVYQDELEHNYVRGKCKKDKVTGKYTFDDKTTKVKEYLVINLSTHYFRTRVTTYQN